MICCKPFIHPAHSALQPAYYRSTGATLRPTCESTDSTSTGYTGTGTSTVVCEMQNERYAAARTPRVLPVQIQAQLTVLASMQYTGQPYAVLDLDLVRSLRYPYSCTRSRGYSTSTYCTPNDLTAVPVCYIRYTCEQYCVLKDTTRSRSG